MEKLLLTTAYDGIGLSPFVSLDLADYAEPQRAGDNNFDARTTTPSGKATTYARARRVNIPVLIDSMPASDVAILEDMKRRRMSVALLPDYGEHTEFASPGERDADPLIGEATFGRASAATYVGDDGKIYEANTNAPRFESCGVGKGILLEEARTNYLFPSHPASGATVWLSFAGTPGVMFDPNMPSNVDGEDGVTRVRMAQSDIISMTTTGLTTTSPYSITFWAKGRGSFVTTLSGFTDGESLTESLSMTWTRYTIRNAVASIVAPSVLIIASEDDTMIYISATQVEEGKYATSYIPTTTGTATRAIDEYAATALGAMNAQEGSVSMFVRLPERDDDDSPVRMLWKLTGNFHGKIADDGDIVFVYSGAPGYVSVVPTGAAGDVVHLAFVWKDDYIAIIEDGVVLGFATTNARSIDNTAAALYFYSTTMAPNTVLGNIRLDAEFIEWRTSESGNEYDKFNDPALLSLYKTTQGRRFEITDDNLSSRRGNPAYYVGGFKLAEVDSDENHVMTGA